MRAQLLAFVALTALLFASGAQLSAGGGSGRPSEGATPPSDTTLVWINTGDGAVYHYHSWAGVWLDPGQMISFSQYGVLTPAKRVRWGNHNAAVDTTSGQGDGYFFPDSMLVSAYCFTNKANNTPAIQVQLYEVTTFANNKLIVDVAWSASEVCAEAQTTLGGPGRYAVIISADAVASHYWFRMHKFYRKV